MFGSSGLDESEIQTFRHPSCSAEFPAKRWRELASAPCSTRIWTMSLWPAMAAAWRGCSPAKGYSRPRTLQSKDQTKIHQLPKLTTEMLWNSRKTFASIKHRGNKTSKMSQIESVYFKFQQSNIQLEKKSYF